MIILESGLSFKEASEKSGNGVWMWRSEWDSGWTPPLNYPNVVIHAGIPIPPKPEGQRTPSDGVMAFAFEEDVNAKDWYIYKPEPEQRIKEKFK